MQSVFFNSLVYVQSTFIENILLHMITYLGKNIYSSNFTNEKMTFFEKDGTLRNNVLRQKTPVNLL